MNIILDECDKELLSHNWTPLKSKHITYAKASIHGKQVLLHRLVAERAGLTLCGVIDHINGNALDNRRNNLQACTQQQNMMKQRNQVGSAIRFKGVVPFRNKWRARITINRHTHHLGLFLTEELAAKAYATAAKHFFGKFASAEL